MSNSPQSSAKKTAKPEVNNLYRFINKIAVQPLAEIISSLTLLLSNLSRSSIFISLVFEVCARELPLRIANMSKSNPCDGYHDGK